MPKRKATYQSGRYAKRYRSRGSAATAIQRAWRARRRPRANINISRLRTGGVLGLSNKFVVQDVTTGTFIGSDTWVYCDHASAALGAVPRGDGISERIGNKVNVRGMSFKLKFSGWREASTTSAQVLGNITSPQRFRVVVFIDKQTNGVQTGATNVFPNSFTAFRDMSNIDRFEVLHDSIHYLKASSTSVAYNGTNMTCAVRYVGHTNFYLDQKFRMTYAVGSTGDTINSLQDASVHLMVVGPDTSLMDGNLMEGTVKTYYEG